MYTVDVYIYSIGSLRKFLPGHIDSPFFETRFCILLNLKGLIIQNSSRASERTFGMLHAETFPHHGRKKRFNRRLSLLGFQWGMMMRDDSADLFDLQYDEYCNLLGGAPWERAVRAALSPKMTTRLAELRSSLSSSDQYLLSEGGRLFPLEILWLKWHLFLKLLKGIASGYQASPRPILNIDPERVRITFPELERGIVPRRWAFSIETSRLIPADPFVPQGLPAGLDPVLFTPPLDLPPLYASSDLLAHPLRAEESASILIANLERIRSQEKKDVEYLMKAQVISNRLRGSVVASRDLIGLLLFLPEEPTPLRFWGRKGASLERGFLFEGKSEPGPLRASQVLERNRNRILSGCTVSLYKSFGFSDDLFSLGIILLRTLLVNDRFDLNEVVEAARLLKGEFGPSVRAGEHTHPIFLRKWRESLEAELFATTALLYSHEERSRAVESIPQDLWSDAILFAIRLLEPPADSSRPASAQSWAQLLTAPLCQEAERLERRIKIELFGFRRRNREVREACMEMRKELASARKETDAI